MRNPSLSKWLANKLLEEGIYTTDFAEISNLSVRTIERFIELGAKHNFLPVTIQKIRKGMERFGWIKDAENPFDVPEMPKKTIVHGFKTYPLHDEFEDEIATGPTLSEPLYDDEDCEFQVSIKSPFNWSELQKNTIYKEVENMNADFRPKHDFLRRLGL